mgnify:CR=1 FL=1
MAYIAGVVFLLSIMGLNGAQANSATPAECQIWKVPVEVDPPKHDLRPFYVEMHRCLGQCTGKLSISPLQCECVPATTQDVTLKVVTLSGLKPRVFKNHTSCRSQCKTGYKERCIQDGHSWDERTCTCSCPQPLGGSCPSNQFWNTRSCQCECSNTPSSCSLNMAWNKSSCSCQCSVMAFAKCSKKLSATNLKTCRCTGRRRPVITNQVSHSQSDESQTKLVVSLVVIGLLLGTLFIIDLVLLCSNKGFMYAVKTKCSEKKGKDEFINQVEAETGSIALDMDVNQSVKSENCKHKGYYTTQDSVTSV